MKSDVEVMAWTLVGRMLRWGDLQVCALFGSILQMEVRIVKWCSSALEINTHLSLY